MQKKSARRDCGGSPEKIEITILTMFRRRAGEGEKRANRRRRVEHAEERTRSKKGEGGGDGALSLALEGERRGVVDDETARGKGPIAV